MKNGASVQQCDTNTTSYVIQKPCMGSNVMVELSKDEPTAFNFGVEDIRAMKLLGDGGMLLTFNDGSTLTITNFAQAKDHFPFTDIALSDGTVMNLQKVAMGLADTLPQDTVADLTILKPQGTLAQTEFTLQQGKTYTLGFDMKEVAAVDQHGSDLVVAFKDGTQLTLHDYAEVNGSPLPPQMTLADGSVVPAAQLINVLNVAAAEQIKTVEPAAGEESHAAKHVAVEKPVQVAQADVSAEKLAQIEPAAGTAAAAPGGSGYGFNSSVDPVSIGTLSPVGPIGVTALAFGLPTLQEGPTVVTPAAVPLATATLSANNTYTYEDTPVNLQIAGAGSNPAGQTLTVTISGIPTGWTVDIGASGGGTYNPTTHTYTITLPQGHTYQGGPVLIPPHNSDADIAQPTNPPLHVTMVATDVGTGATEIVEKDMNVIVDAVADQPDLAVVNVSGSDNVPLALDIHAAVTDTDGSEVLTTATLTGIPAGFTLNHGTLSGGVWTVNAADLSDLKITAPRGYDGSFVVTVRVNNEEAHLTDQEITLTNNTNFNVESFLVTFVDTTPVVGNSQATVDDTSLSAGPNVVNGSVSINYQLDTPGTFAPTSTFSAGGSLAGGHLSSHGSPVTVTLSGNTYTGKDANGTTVFTLVVNSDGTYTFTQLHELDHADPNNPNDSISLNFTVAATDADGDTANGVITINVLDDAPIAANDTLATDHTATGNVTSNDTLSQDVSNTVTQVVYNGTTYTVPTTGTVTIAAAHGTLVIDATGHYTYTSNNSGPGDDVFRYTLRDYDGDTSQANLTATVTDIDTIPVVGNSEATVDETALPGGPNVATGTVPADYFADAPGAITAVNNFSAGGSLLGGHLSSHGSPVAVTLSGNQYTGKDAGGTTIFTLVVNPDGTYTFTQYHQLDHADGSNPNDVIDLNFTVRGTDSDGDFADGTITIHVRDDAPIANNDDFVSSTGTATGNIIANDHVGVDTPGRVYDVTFGGETKTIPDGGSVTFANASGTLVINSLGQFTFTPPVAGQGTSFTYHLIDFDGDKSVVDANHGHVTIDTNGVPTITGSAVTVDETNLANSGTQTVSGTYTYDFGGDGQGTTGGIKNNGYTGPSLTSQGSAVTVTLSGNTYTGKDANGTTVFTMVINTDGHYTFTQFKELDHPNPNDPNDALNLKFLVTITDANGDTANGTITATVLDDGPVAVNDSFVSSTGTSTGNIMANDHVGADTPGRVYDVTFGGETKTIPDGGSVTFANASGTLVINSLGQFTFTPPVAGQGTSFTYHLIDFDGDKSVVDANHGHVTIDTNGVPTITGSAVTVDETTMADTGTAQVAHGTYTYSYGGDGQGTTGGIAAVAYTGPALKSQGQDVTVTLSGNTFTGKVGSVTIFTMVVNTDGTYTFTQFKELDHPNPNDPNDALNLGFTVRITDSNGDSAIGTLTATVLDDGPVANNDTFISSSATASGNIMANDHVGADTPGRVYDVTFGGETKTLPADGSSVTFTNASGTLVINASGAFTFTPPLAGQGATFTYHLIDFDGDKSVVDANHGHVTIDTNAIPIVGDSVVVTDETSLISGPSVTTGTVSASFFGDGPGVISAVNTFTSGGSEMNGHLTSHGSPVTVTLSGNTWTGKDANGTTVFTLQLATDGSYTFTQFKELDHADPNNPNDIINLNFTVKGTDVDGDSDTGIITVNVRDDAPSALDDTVNMPSGTMTATGNVLANDTPGQDVPVPVVSVVYNGTTYALPQDGSNVTITGAHGTLVINSTGAYTYTSSNTTTGTDQFTYTIRDYDGDRSTAHLNVTVTDINTVPVVDNSTISLDETNLDAGPVVMGGQVPVNYFNDGPGTITAVNQFSAGGSLMGGHLTSHGSPVTVTLSGNTWTGKDASGATVFTLVVTSSGAYTFTQFHELDHADPNNPNDVINLNFTVKGTDADGDSDTGVITVQVLDDAPVAINDSFLSSTSTATGNIMANDHVGADVSGRVYDVTFGGETRTLPADGSNVTITNSAGTLVINSTGQFTFTPPLAGQGATFTYHLIDFDGDKSVVDANHGTVTVDTNGVPVVTDASGTVMEAGSHDVNGIVTANFFGDGPGTFVTCGDFSATGSLMNGRLTTGGVAITVTNTGHGYVGTANGQTVFTLDIAANGTYTFHLLKPLDHGNPNDPNDVIDLNFQVCAVDKDGDVGHGTLAIHVVDSGPVATSDLVNYCANDYFHNGNLITGFNPGGGSAGVDVLGWDSPTTVYAISSTTGGTHGIATTGVTEIDGQHGKLYVFSNGAYVYYASDDGQYTDTFTYYLKDYDGDASSATLSVTAQSSHSANASIIVVSGTTYGDDGNNALIAYAQGCQRHRLCGRRRRRDHDLVR
ncbi:MAG: cadherin-like domain-containing protein [Rhodospirillales bacterium]|nr:cadherin-like domain-containing protein [Rhodospirillales bacterium]